MDYQNGLPLNGLPLKNPISLPGSSQGPIILRIYMLPLQYKELTVNTLTKVHSRLTGVNCRLTGVNSRLTGVHSRLTGVKSRLTRVHSRPTEVSSSH